MEMPRLKELMKFRIAVKFLSTGKFGVLAGLLWEPFASRCTRLPCRISDCLLCVEILSRAGTASSRYAFV